MPKGVTITENCNSTIRGKNLIGPKSYLANKRTKKHHLLSFEADVFNRPIILLPFQEEMLQASRAAQDKLWVYRTMPPYI